MSVRHVTEPLGIRLDSYAGTWRVVDADGIAWATGIVLYGDAELALIRIRREQEERDGMNSQRRETHDIS